MVSGIAHLPSLLCHVQGIKINTIVDKTIIHAKISKNWAYNIDFENESIEIPTINLKICSR